MSHHPLGIDFGATAIVSASTRPDGTAQALTGTDGHRATPPVVHFTPDGETLVGRDAVSAAAGAPQRTVDGIRDRLRDTAWTIHVDGVAFGIVDVAAIVLQKVADDARPTVGTEPAAVIAVPATFSDLQRTAVVDAARAAGLNVLRLINAPAAAALAYATSSGLRGNVLVYTLDGCEIDTTVVTVASPTEIEVVACDGAIGALDAPLDELVARSERTVTRTLKEASIKPDRIDGVVLVGDGAHDRSATAMLHRNFGSEILGRIDPIEVVAQGAAIRASLQLRGRTDAGMRSAA